MWEGLSAHECSTYGGQERALDLPGPAVINSCELFDVGAGNLNSGPLQEECVCLTTKPSLALSQMHA